MKSCHLGAWSRRIVVKFKVRLIHRVRPYKFASFVKKIDAYGSFACMCVCAPCVCLVRPDEGMDLLALELQTVVSSLLDARICPGPLQAQPVLLAATPSPLLPVSSFFFKCKTKIYEDLWNLTLRSQSATVKVMSHRTKWNYESDTTTFFLCVGLDDPMASNQ